MIVLGDQSSKDKYVRFYDMTSSEEIKEGVNFAFFDFAPMKIKLELRRGSKRGDYLPSKDELIDEKDAAYVSGQSNYKKNFVSIVMSRFHATVRWSPTQLHPVIVDEGSTHGTFLMHLGRGVGFSEVPKLSSEDPRWESISSHKPVILKDGDVIQLGRNVPKITAENSDPQRLFVEVYQSERHGVPILEKKSKSANLISDKQEDDDVVETTDPNLQRENAKKQANVKKQMYLVLSDDESDVEELGEFEVDTVNDVEDYSIVGCGSDEEIGPSDEEVDAQSDVDSDADEEIEGEESGESRDEEDHTVDSEEESEEDEEEEGEIPKTTTISITVEEPVIKVLDAAEDDLIDDGEGIFEEDKMDEILDVQSAMGDFVDSIMDKGIREDVEAPVVTEPITSGSEGEEMVEDVTYAASSNGSSSGSSSETKITASESIDDTPDKMLLEKTVVEDTTMIEEPAVLEVTGVQAVAGNKRSHDEVEDAEVKTSKDTPPPIVAAAMPSNEAVASQSRSLLPSLNPHKKIKTFGAGLAAGLVAGMVGTFVGLSSLALSDSSLV